jgi:S1-C subfamily serine protease
LVVVMVVAAGTLLAGEGKKCTHPTQDCLNYMAAHYKDRGWLGVEYTPETMEITRVIPDSPAESSGFMTGDMMVAINGIALGGDDTAELEKVKKVMVPGSKVTYTVRRGGDATDLEVKLGPVPEQVLVQWIGRHMLEGHAELQLASAN